MPRYNYSSNPEATQAPGFSKAVLPDGDYLLFIRDVQVKEAGTYVITEFKLMDCESMKFHDYAVVRKVTDGPTDEAGSPSIHIRKLGALNESIHGKPIDFDDESQAETEHVYLAELVRATIKARTYKKRDNTEQVDNDPRDWRPAGGTKEERAAARAAVRAFLGDNVAMQLRDRKAAAKAAYDAAGESAPVASPPAAAAPPTPPADTFSDDEIPF